MSMATKLGRLVRPIPIKPRDILINILVGSCDKLRVTNHPNASVLQAWQGDDLP